MVVVRDLLAASLSMAVRCHCDAAVFGPAWLLLYAVCVSHIFLVGGLSSKYNIQAFFRKSTGIEGHYTDSGLLLGEKTTNRFIIYLSFFSSEAAWLAGVQ